MRLKPVISASASGLGLALLLSLAGYPRPAFVALVVSTALALTILANLLRRENQP